MNDRNKPVRSKIYLSLYLAAIPISPNSHLHLLGDFLEKTTPLPPSRPILWGPSAPPEIFAIRHSLYEERTQETRTADY